MNHRREHSVRWAENLLRRQGLSARPEYKALLASAHEHFMEGLGALGISEHQAQQILDDNDGSTSISMELDSLSAHARGLLADLQRLARPRPRGEQESLMLGGYLCAAYRELPTMRGSVTLTFDQAASIVATVLEVLHFLGLTSEQIRESLAELPPCDIAVHRPVQEKSHE